MSEPTALRPRSNHQREAMSRVLHRAPYRVATPPNDDGWTAVQLRIAGRMPVVAPIDKPRIDGVLERFGLPPCETLEEVQPEATLTAELRLVGGKTPEARPLPAVEGPLISILMCTYNRRSMIDAALQSALAQRWPAQIVVVNDGSTDGTREYLDAQLERYADRDLVVVHKDNGGKPTALNAALEAATGDAVLVLDDDDLLLPGALHVLGRLLFSRPELGMAFGDTITFHGSSGRPNKWVAASRHPHPMGFENTLTSIPGMPGACLIRRTVQDEVGNYDLDLIRGQDMDMYLRLAHAAPYSSIPFATFLYRAHAGLRGSAKGQWGRDEHDARFRKFVQPTFLRRFQQRGPKPGEPGGTGRDSLRYTWALGLFLRGLEEEAHALIGSDAGPYSRRQAWVRSEMGLQTSPTPRPECVVVVHDGDEGALEETLFRHADGRDVHIHFEVPADPLKHIQVHWPGTLTTGADLPSKVEHEGVLVLRLSSAPSWSPPPIPDPSWLMRRRGSSAIWATAAALGWPLPERDRAFAPPVLDAATRAVLQARAKADAGDPAGAMGVVEPVLADNPEWRAGWFFAATLFEQLGFVEQAGACARLAGDLRAA